MVVITKDDDERNEMFKRRRHTIQILYNVSELELSPSYDKHPA